MLFGVAVEVSNAPAYASGLGDLLSSKGLADSTLCSPGSGVGGGCRSFLISGSMPTVGTAHRSRTMLIQNGSHKLRLMVKDARVGPMKFMIYDTEVM
jgi:hypothetical protein